MSLDRMQSELLRLQMHPVNLAASASDGALVTLKGSLLPCWKVPSLVDGAWFLEILEPLPDAAGPQVVMSAICEALANMPKRPTMSDEVAR